MDFIIEQKGNIDQFLKILSAVVMFKGHVTLHMSRRGIFLMQNQNQLDTLVTLGKQTIIAFLNAGQFLDIRENRELRDLNEQRSRLEYYFEINAENLMKSLQGVKKQIKKIILQVGYINDDVNNYQRQTLNVIIIFYSGGQFEYKFNVTFEETSAYTEIMMKSLVERCFAPTMKGESREDYFTIMSLNEKIIHDLRNINKGCTLGFNLREDIIEISPTLNVKNLSIGINKQQLGNYSYLGIVQAFGNIQQVLVDPNFFLPIGKILKYAKGQIKLSLGKQVSNDMCQLTLTFTKDNSYFVVNKSTAILHFGEDNGIQTETKEEFNPNNAADESIIDYIAALIEAQEFQKESSLEPQPSKKIKFNN